MSKEIHIKWKTIAIIFIIIAILEAIFMIWAWNYGTESIENETYCSVEVCQYADAFFYDDYTKACYCYVDNEIVSQEIIE